MDVIKNNKHITWIFFFLLISIITFSVFFSEGSILYADDLWFHTERSEYWYQLLVNKQPYSYGNFITNSQWGIPLDAFYPFITYMPLVFIRLFFPSPIVSWYIYWVLIFWIGMIINYYVALKIYNQTLVAVSFSFFYSFTQYRLFNLFWRAAVGENLAMLFFPVVILGLYQLIHQDKKGWIPLSLGMVMIIYSHLLSTILIAIYLIAICCLNLKAVLNKEFLLQIVKAVMLFLVLSSIVLLPLAEQFIELGSVTVWYRPLLSASTTSLFNLVGMSLKNSVFYYFIGTLVMGVFLVAPFLHKKLSDAAKQMLWLSWITIAFMCFINFDRLQYTAIAKIQFIWRFNAILSVFAAFIFADMYASCINKPPLKKYRYLINFLVAFIGAISIFSMYHAVSLRAQDKVILSDENYYERMGERKLLDYRLERYYEYKESLVNDEIKTSPKDVEVRGRVEDNKLIYRIESQKEGAWIDTVIPYYKGIMVESDGKLIGYMIGERGTLLLHTSKPTQEFTIFYKWTNLQKVSWVITLVGWSGFCVFQGYQKYQRKKKSS